MRCRKGAIKHRMNPHNGRTKGDYKVSSKGHVWKRDIEKTACSLCGFVKKWHFHAKGI
jgi:hypothetical protein